MDKSRYEHRWRVWRAPDGSWVANPQALWSTAATRPFTSFAGAIRYATRSARSDLRLRFTQSMSEQ